MSTLNIFSKDEYNKMTEMLHVKLGSVLSQKHKRNESRVELQESREAQFGIETFGKHKEAFSHEDKLQVSEETL
jgi:hypothetical protein